MHNTVCILYLTLRGLCTRTAECLAMPTGDGGLNQSNTGAAWYTSGYVVC